MTRSSVNAPGFGDQISRTAQQVRSLTRNPKAVHRLLAAVPVSGGGGRAYRTACHKLLPNAAGDAHHGRRRLRRVQGGGVSYQPHDEPTCCGVTMVHNSGTGQYECADAYFALVDDGVIWDYDPPALCDPENVSAEHRALYEHWLKSMRPDGWDQP